MIEKTFRTFVQDVVEYVKYRDDKEDVELLRKVYNEYVENERGGNDYIFNINDKKDLAYLVTNCDVTAKEISEFYKTGMPYIFLNDKSEWAIVTNMLGFLSGHLNGIVTYTILYVCRYGNDSVVAQFYDKYITQFMESKEDLF